MEQAHRKYGLSRYFKKIFMFREYSLVICNISSKSFETCWCSSWETRSYWGGISIDTMYPELLKVGDDVTISTNVTIITHFMNPTGKYQRSYVKGPVVISPQVFIGAGVIICKSVTIGEGAVVGAGSIVTKDIPAGEIWAGNPARFIRKR